MVVKRGVSEIEDERLQGWAAADTNAQGDAPLAAATLALGDDDAAAAAVLPPAKRHPCLLLLSRVSMSK